MFSRHLEMWFLGLKVNPIVAIVRVMELDKFSEEGHEERGVFPSYTYHKGCTPFHLESLLW